jgi:hypothetical protein
MKKLHISPDLSLPVEAVTQTFAILAKRGVGKTYTALVMVEELLKAELQTVVADPVGVCWGLRSSADGKAAGFPIVVLGGEHADVPLEATAGETVADFIIESGQSAVLDLSLFRKGEQTRFMTDFSERLYHKNRRPLHLLLDEADAFAPQKPMRGQERMLGAVEDLVRRGRARGIGLTLVTQRSAVLNKDVLTQVEVMVALRTISPQDLKAMEAWITVHGTPEQQQEMMESLPSLPVGTAWFWSPGWLDVFQRVKVRKRETFDSSATPKVGDAKAIPKRLAEVNLDELRARMAATIEQAKANDPKELRRQVAELRRELERAGNAPPPAESKVERVEVQVLHPDHCVRLELALTRADSVAEKVENLAAGAVEDIKEAAAIVRDALARAKQQVAPPATFEPRVATGAPGLRARPARSAPPPPRQEAPPDGDRTLSKPQQRILDTLIMFESLGRSEMQRSVVAVLSGASPTSSGFSNNLGALKNDKQVNPWPPLVSYPRPNFVALTAEGRALAHASDISSLADLHAAWLRVVSRPQVDLVRELIKAYPEAVEKVELAVRVGVSPTSSGYSNNLGHLRNQLGIADYPRPGYVVATDLLFPEGLR